MPLARRSHLNLRLLSSVPRRQLAGQRVLVRIDINTELIGGRVRDLSRFQAIKKTVSWLTDREAIVILLAHRGRPTKRQAALSLRPYLRPLQQILAQPVSFFVQPIGSRALQLAVQRLQPGQVALLENIRFEPGETNNDRRLAKRLASLGSLAVNEAFSDSHRGHASMSGLAHFLPMVAGWQLVQELKSLEKYLSRPKRPYVAVIGGAKISSKLGLVRKLLRQADAVLLGGALANTVLKAEGVAVGASLIEPAMIRAARGLRAASARLHIPVDVYVSSTAAGGARRRAVGMVRPTERILDVGPDTVDVFSRALKTAKTIVWNGPMGVYERPPFDRATKKIAQVIARQSAVAVAGGGETIDAIRRQRLDSRFDFLSTGGGAMLEWLEGKTLPGVQVCMKGFRP